MYIISITNLILKLTFLLLLLIETFSLLTNFVVIDDIVQVIFYRQKLLKIIYSWVVISNFFKINISKTESIIFMVNFFLWFCISEIKVKTKPWFSLDSYFVFTLTCLAAWSNFKFSVLLQYHWYYYSPGPNLALFRLF